MKRTTGVWSLLLSISLALLVFNNCDVTNVFAGQKKPKKMRVVFIGDISGPYAPITAPTANGMIDALEYVNDELGGIDGVRMEGTVMDDGGRVSVGISHYMEVREMKPKPAMVYVIVSALGEALRERFAEDKIPAMSVTGVPAIYPVGYTFGWFPLYPDLFGAFVDWVAENWDKPRAPRVAFLTWDTTYGRGPVTPEAYAYAKSKGVDMVATEFFSPRDVFVGSQILRIRSKKADWIYTNSTATGPPAIAKSARESGLKINFAGGLGLDWCTIYIGPKVMEGAITVMPFASLDDENHPGIKVLMKYFKKNKRRKFDRTVMYEISWCLVLTTREAIKRVVDKSGWENVNGENIKKEMERMKDFSPLGLITYTFTPKKHTGDATYIGQIKDGKIVAITDWRKCPDLRPAKFK